VPKETVPGEKRVGLIPETVSRLAGEADILIEAGAGAGSSISDDEYAEAGATIAPDARTLYERADLVIKVQAPTDDEVAQMHQGATLISFLAPLIHHDRVRALADRGVTSLAMDAVPRITRAQSMDALSAMSTIGGYKAALLAADHLPKFFPLLMTAAGTIAPAKVLVIGAGVAGLQAIATARRLGAVVEAYDTRPVVKEQVESLGARFVEIDTGAQDTQEASGYARAATEEELRRQQEGLNDHIAKSDVVITTALVPGKPAPRLIPASAVAAMRPGSVILDLASEAGGNCELSEPGETVVREGVTIMAPLNLPSMLPVHASQMYARTIQNLLALLLRDGRIELNLDDEILKGMCITRDGKIIHEQTRRAMGLEDAPAPVPAAESPGADDDQQPQEDDELQETPAANG
jgi:NAD(P) transhydrogenase subunit alpha